jgi:hypothetical protein
LSSTSGEENDIALLRRSVDFLDQEFLASEPADFSNDALVKRHRPFPLQLFGRVLGGRASKVALQREHVDRDDRIRSARLRVSIKIDKISLCSATRELTGLLTSSRNSQGTVAGRKLHHSDYSIAGCNL